MCANMETGVAEMDTDGGVVFNRTGRTTYLRLERVRKRFLGKVLGCRGHALTKIERKRAIARVRLCACVCVCV